MPDRIRDWMPAIIVVITAVVTGVFSQIRLEGHVNTLESIEIRIEQDVAEMKSDLKALYTEQSETGERVARIEGRLNGTYE